MTQTKAERAAYMREYGKRRIRTKEERRAEYLRTRERGKWREQRHKETPDYARMVLAREMGIPKAIVPQGLVEARFQQIVLRRALRDAKAKHFYPLVVEQYVAGSTVRNVAKAFGMDVEHVNRVLREAGVTIRRRPSCKHGHAFTDENTAYSPQGWRRCRACARRKTAEYERRKREACMTTHTTKGDE